MSATLPLRLGTVAPEGLRAQRSGLRWLVRDGQRVRPGDVLGYCQLGVLPPKGGITASPMAMERLDFGVAFSAPFAGRVRPRAGTSRGGMLDRLRAAASWDPEEVVAEIEPEAEVPPGARVLGLLFTTGLRVNPQLAMRSGLLSGWYARRRAWWGDAGGEAPPTLACLGSCDIADAIAGEEGDFREFHAGIAGPAHLVLLPEIMPVTAGVSALEAMRRTPAELQAISEGMRRAFADGPPPGAEDWLFAGSLLAALGRNPVALDAPLLTQAGITRVARPDAILFSLIGDARTVLRHRTQGWSLALHGYRLQPDLIGPATRAWLDAAFVRETRSFAQQAAEMAELVAALRAAIPGPVVVANQATTTGRDQLHAYAAFDAPLSEQVAAVRNRDWTLLLTELARSHGMLVLDVDAILAEMGMAAHMPDGTHPSGALQAALRQETARLLREAGLPGFAPRAA
ncbi:hypothetical protein [Falsiroseomonas selenitidurans]|uniref:SGNH hydrolase-type esterase domain-containing protein n=1 Tax=Falsiroseomonas selenitidurans TaxID=2716335 RepID=A0ABX1EBJ5_9PROT|nr:hypothetical protein [Falsiroseomonas selenitidurans]NKC34604.1 hypothetical protein [Falsiroseomonas selenitidurans]